MTTEEKAKAYDEALEKARMYRDNAKAVEEYAAVARYENIFPQLRESEDERIRKDIVAAIEMYGDFTQSRKEEIYAYLEKQKEQKPNIEHIQQSWYMEGYTDREHNREPKWIVNTGEEGPKYELNPKYGQDLIKEQKLNTFNEPYNPDECEVVMEGNAISLKRKEQKSVDYDHEMWKNCEANFDGGKKEVIEHPEKYGLQKPAEWSEVDERKRNELIKGLENRMGFGWASDPFSREEYISWLKSLHPVKQEWSEEDEKHINLILRILDRQQCWNGATGKKFNPYQGEIDWLKSLRPQPHTVSTKDATKFGNLEYERGVKDGIESEKSHQWKPSEEQIRTLGYYMSVLNCNEYKEILFGLYEQLKKLM